MSATTSSEPTGPSIGPFERELRRGVLEMLLLRLLAGGRSYGYRIVTEIAERTAGALEVKEGTIYPLLYRLEKQGLLRTEWDAPERGAPRKYYRLTAVGAERLEAMVASWRRFADEVDRLLDQELEEQEEQEEER